MKNISFNVYLVIAFLIVCFVYLIVFSKFGYLNRQKLNDKLAVLQDDVQALEKETVVLKTYIDHMKNDHYFIEEYARDKLKFSKPGEEIVKFRSIDDT